MHSSPKKAILAVLALALSATAAFGKITESNFLKQGVLLDNDTHLVIIPLADNALRIQYIKQQNNLEEYVYTGPLAQKSFTDYTVKETDNEIVLKCDRISARYLKGSESIIFYNQTGKEILYEKPNSRSISRNGEYQAVSMSFKSPKDEYLIGLGQFQDGYTNIRGLQRRLTQVNTQISIPVVMSNKGYGLIWNNYGMTEFNPGDIKVDLKQEGAQSGSVVVDVTSTAGNRRERRSFGAFAGEVTIKEKGSYSILLDVGQAMGRKHHLEIDGKVLTDVNNTWLPPTTSLITDLEAGTHTITVQGSYGDHPSVILHKVDNSTTFASPVAFGIDYTVIAGQPDEFISTMRGLTGQVPMLPKYALGYIHCRERYNTQEELLENARQFRESNIPVDVIVQDWQWWGKYGWNAMQFDEDKYPAPLQMTNELHDMNMRFMLSVWSKIDRNSTLGKQMQEKDYYIDQTDWIDFFNQDAADFYWQNSRSKILGVSNLDGWWQDATEPENDDLHGRKIANRTLDGDVVRNLYPNMVNRSVYNGLLKDDPERRPMILTRSGFTGLQQYGAINWSGDIGNDWETLRRQIAGGLSLMATGQPWWTYDAGGFFRPGDQYSSQEYQERMLRWIETAVFLPFMRVHGYMSQTEPWHYSEQTKNIYIDNIRWRYMLMPYIYSLAYQVSANDYTMMRPLLFDFTNDATALAQQTEFMFGPSLLVNPITETNVTQWDTYLPENKAGWYYFWTGEKYKGGQTVTTATTLDKIPVFAKGGSMVIENTVNAEYARDREYECKYVTIYPGADCTFTLYQDYADNYDYKNGEYNTTVFSWNDKKRTLTITGGHNTDNYSQDFKIFITGGKIDSVKEIKNFTGNKVTVQF